MKILYVTNQLAMGGIEINLVRLARALSARGHEVIAAAGPGSLVRRFEEAGGRHFSVDLTRLVASHTDIVTLRRLIASEMPDVVHVMSASSAVAVRRALLRTPGHPPIVSSIMGLANAPDESRLVVLLRAWLTTLGADRLILIAPSFERLARWLPVRRRRIVSGVVVGVEQYDADISDPKRGQHTRTRLGVPDGVPLVITVGALEVRNRHDLFVHAAAKVLQSEPSVHFLIVGGGRLEERLRQEIDRLGIGHRVRLVGERHDVDRILAASDVCVRPGLVEGFVGITVLEAQMLAIPVVSFATGDVRMAIEDGVTGMLARNGDPTSLAEAVLRLLSDPEEARAIGIAGYRAVMQRFEIGSVARRLESQYEELTQTKDL